MNNLILLIKNIPILKNNNLSIVLNFKYKKVLKILKYPNLAPQIKYFL